MSLPAHTHTHAHTRTHAHTYIHTRQTNDTDQTARLQYVGSLTARPIKITMFFLNCNNHRGISFPNIIIIIIKQYMYSNYSDKSVQSDERSLIT